jgi:hypothetical protein
LLEPLHLPLVEAAESVGAIQAQYWPAVPVALWSRTRDLRMQDLYEAFAHHELVLGKLLRGTLHVVSARHHPTYAKVVGESGANDWRRTEAQQPLDLGPLRAELASFAESIPRSGEEMVARIEAWVERERPRMEDAELAFQRGYRWRPFLTTTPFIRVPADGPWVATRTPGAFLTAPSAADPPPSREQALVSVIRWHLAAFGPSAAEDVATWIGWRTPLVRTALEALGPELMQFRDEAGRLLYDLPEAPRPDPEVAAPVRLLPWFDSVLLAYARRHRGRILPDAYRDLVYVRANLQWLPTFLVDGLVTGTWSVEFGRRDAALTLKPLGRLARSVRTAVAEEAELLLRFFRPTARSHAVRFVDE